MNIEKYTERARGFIQSAQSLALREGHQQFTPEHVLKVLLDDPEGLASGLIDRSGGNSRQALSDVETALGKMPKVSGSGSGQVYLAAATARGSTALQMVGLSSWAKPPAIPAHCRRLSRSPRSGAARIAVSRGWPAVINPAMPAGRPWATAHHTPPR